jgi:hypothetical protein
MLDRVQLGTLRAELAALRDEHDEVWKEFAFAGPLHITAPRRHNELVIKGNNLAREINRREGELARFVCHFEIDPETKKRIS